MEVGFTFCLGKTKTATGQDLVWWWIGFLAALAMSMYLMAKAAERLPIGTVYPVWTGIGAVGAVIVGIVFFHEPATFWRIFFITTLILSIIGLKVLGWCNGLWDDSSRNFLRNVQRKYWEKENMRLWPYCFRHDREELCGEFFVGHIVRACIFRQQFCAKPQGTTGACTYRQRVQE